MPVSQQSTTTLDSSAPSTDISPESVAEIRSDSTSSARSGALWNKSRELRLRVPWMTLLLASVVVAGYCLQVLADHSTPKHPYDPVLLAVGMKGEAVFAGQWWRLVTAIFVHIDLYHLLSNLCFLLLFGSIAETVFQRAGYLALWFLTGIAGCTSQLLALSPNYYGYGASGVAFGLVAALWSAYCLERVPSPTIVRRWSVVILLGFFIILRIFAGLDAFSFVQRSSPRRPARRNDSWFGYPCSYNFCAYPQTLRDRRRCPTVARGRRENRPRQTRTTITSYGRRVRWLPIRITGCSVAFAITSPA